jgi:hypothetical protein
MKQIENEAGHEPVSRKGKEGDYTDKPKAVEGMVGEKQQQTMFKKLMDNRLSGPLLTLLFLMALAFVTFAIVWVSFFFFDSRNSSHIDQGAPVCKGMLRTIDGAVMEYEYDHGEGIFPTTMEELVPTYLREVPKNKSGGTYYLDTTQTPPRAACSEGHTY